MTQPMISCESVLVAFHTLLYTESEEERKRAHDWIMHTVQPSPETWTIVPSILMGHDMIKHDSPSDSVLFLSAQLLYSKILEDLDQIYTSREKCTELYRFLFLWCFHDSLQVKENKKTYGTALRFKMAECLALSAICFYGFCWETPLQDILAVVTPHLSDGTKDKGLAECLHRQTVVNIFMCLPELISLIESKRSLMRLLGYSSYISWRKTRVGIYLQQEMAKVDMCLISILRQCISQLNDQHFSTLGEELIPHLCFSTIEGCCQAVVRCSSTFRRSFLVSDSPASESVLWDLLCSHPSLLRLPVVTDMLGVLITTVNIPKSLSCLCLDATEFHPHSFGTPLHVSSFGESSYLFLPLLVTLSQVVFPLLNKKRSAYNSTEEHSGISTEVNENQDDLTTFAYHWASITSQMFVVLPCLVTSQSEPLSLRIKRHDSYETVILPPHFSIQLIHLFTCFSLETFQKMLNIWQDLSDLVNNEALCDGALHFWLQEVAPLTVQQMLYLMDGDHPFWRNQDSSITDSDIHSRSVFIETCQDITVILYYLFQRISAEAEWTFLNDLTNTLYNALARQAFGTAAAVLYSLSAIMESLVHPLDEPKMSLLLKINQHAFSHRESYTIYCDMISKLCLSLPEENLRVLWKPFLERLAADFSVNPHRCSETIFTLCDTASDSIFADKKELYEIIESFYHFLDSQRRQNHDQLEFLPAFYGAIACLIDRLPENERSERFSSLLAPLTQVVQESVRILNHALPSHHEATLHKENLTVSFYCVARVLGILHLKPDVPLGCVTRQSSLLPPMKANSVSRVFSFLFPQNDSLDVVKCYGDAAKILLRDSLRQNTKLNMILPVKDCFHTRKREKYLCTTLKSPQSVSHLVIHVLRLFVIGINLNAPKEFWKFMILDLPHTYYQNEPFNTMDGSFCFLLSDMAGKLWSFHHKEPDAFSVWPTNHARDVYFVWLESFEKLFLPLIVAKAQHVDVDFWSEVLKPFFLLFSHTLHLWETINEWRETALHHIVPILIKALCSSNHKLHPYCWDCCCCLLKSLNPLCQKIMLEFYDDLVATFWNYCHGWDLSRMTPAVPFMDSLIHSTNDSQQAQRFLHRSWQLWEQSTNSFHDQQGLLFTFITEETMKFLLRLLGSAHGFRLRQILMDLVKISQQLATPDCLASYQFLLSSPLPKNQNEVHVMTLD